MPMVEEKPSPIPGLSDFSRSVNIHPPLKAKALNKPKAILNTCRFIEIFAVIITCIVLVHQSSVLVKQVKESKLTRDLQVAGILREHYQTINKVLVEHDSARDAFGLKPEGVMAYMLLAEYDSLFQMFDEDMIGLEKWNSIVEPLISTQMTQNKKIPIEATLRGDRTGRSAGFLKYVEACVYENFSNPPSTPKDLQKVRERACPPERDPLAPPQALRPVAERWVVLAGP